MLQKRRFGGDKIVKDQHKISGELNKAIEFDIIIINRFQRPAIFGRYLHLKQPIKQTFFHIDTSF
jgi:hypothetical protein